MKISRIIEWLKENGTEFEFKGDPDIELGGFSSLANYKSGCITWIKKEEKYDEAGRPKDITAAIVQKGCAVDFDNAIIADDSKKVFFGILHEFWGSDAQPGSIGKGTVIADEATVDPTAVIGCNCTITGEAVIGAGTVIENNVVIEGRVRIGKGCNIHSGTVIGPDGFGFTYDDDCTMHKVEHFGGVVIGDDVEIGACTVIERGTIDDTVIGSGTKIGNLVHIGHNVQVGNKVSIVCGNLVCGSSRIEDGAYIAPGGMVRNQITVKERGFVGLGALAVSTVEEDTVVIGIPAKPIRKVKKGDK
ncbi:MAG: hypothetical protein K6F73_05440 [Lachnospiraceae bacterium]|nr:hypothetical protein [Lachnospiraceae bacterium]